MAEGKPPHGTEPRLRLSDSCKRLPVKEISPSTRKFLARWLDPPTEGLNEGFLQQNWVGLAELINFDNQTIQNLEASKKSPTEELLKAYVIKANANVGNLWGHLLDLERYDVLEEDKFVWMLERDLIKFQEREEEKEKTERRLRAEAENSRPLQVHNVTSGTFEEEEDWEKLDADTDQYEHMVVDDVETGKTTYFDAFVSYCHDDLPFVQEMIRMLETVHGLKLCVNARDLLAGGSRHFITARLIADRCRKVILVMSPSFLRSPECEFQVKVALSLSPGAKRKILIPILFKYCKMPLVLQHVCLVDYTKSDLAEWFWGRLAASLKESRRHKRLIPPEELNSLEAVKYNLDYDYKTSDRPDINTLEVNDAARDILEGDPNHFGWGMPENIDDLFAKNNSGDSCGNDNDQTTMKITEGSFGRRSLTQQQNTTQNLMPSRQPMTSSSCGYPSNNSTSTASSIESPLISRNQMQQAASASSYQTKNNDPIPNSQLPLTVTSLFSDRSKDFSSVNSTERLLPDPDILQSISSADIEIHSGRFSNLSTSGSYAPTDFQIGLGHSSVNNTGTISHGSRNTDSLPLLPDDSAFYHSGDPIVIDDQDWDNNQNDSLPDVNPEDDSGPLRSGILKLFPPIPGTNSTNL